MNTPWDRIAGYIINALAGIGLLAFFIACAVALGYWSNV